MAHRQASGLPFGTLKRIEIARALASGPRLLLLDEPAAGLNHEEVEYLGQFLRRLQTDFDLTLLLVEHHMNLVMGISDRVYVLDFGRVIAEGTPREVQQDPQSSRRISGAQMPLLELRDVTARYGGVQALDGVSLSVDEGQIISVLGANGAGKTTTLRAISGTVKRNGTLTFAGRPAVARGGRARRHRARSGGTRHVLRADRLGEPPPGRVRSQGELPRGLRRAAKHFPWLEERRTSRPARSPAASSRCSRSRARSSAARG